jgi:hypothetical protein
VIAVVVAAIWVFIELKRFKHKLFAIFLIALIIFSYLGFILAVKGQDVDLKSVNGIKEAGNLYFSWLGTIFGNFKQLTSNAVKMDWKGDSEKVNEKKSNLEEKENKWISKFKIRE